jgi:hypothetical protein
MDVDDSPDDSSSDDEIECQPRNISSSHSEPASGAPGLQQSRL